MYVTLYVSVLISSTTGKFTCNIKGLSNILSSITGELICRLKTALCERPVDVSPNVYLGTEELFPRFNSDNY